MGVIRRIYIKNFRSIHELLLEPCNTDLNILVGNNDIGKSNILRALNLFFNGETDLGSPLNFWEDFNKNTERTSGKGQYIKIALEITLKYEKEKYLRWTKQWGNNGKLVAERKEVFTDDDKKSNFVDRSRARAWIDSIIFRYVPAIKSPIYFQHLFEELHDLMSTTYSEQFERDTGALIASIQNITRDMTEELKDTIGIENRISLPADLKAFFGALDFSLEANERKFNLKSRGDGIKARHIPVILRFMASKVKAYRRGALDIQTIWGFEEPENNLEMSHAFDMARNFLKYSESIHIFLSTHSPAFYSLKENSAKVNCWFVERNDQGFTIAKDLKNTSDIDLDEKMGMLAYITPILRERDAEINQHKKEKAEMKEQLELLRDSTKAVIFTEDESSDLEMIKSFIFHQGFKEGEIEFYSYRGKDNFGGALIAADTFLKKNGNIQAVIFHRDMDVDGEYFRSQNQAKLTAQGRKNYYLLMPTGYDLESEYLNAEHICTLYPELSVDEIAGFIDQATKEAETTSLEKLKNVYLKVKVKQKLNEGVKIDDIKFNSLYKEVEQMYSGDVLRYRYGKKVLGIVIAKLQKRLGKKINLLKPSDAIKRDELVAIANRIWISEK